MELRQGYIAVKNENEVSYGGSQNWYEKGILYNFGCGVVALGDILLYLAKTGRHPLKTARKLGEMEKVDKEEYLSYLKDIGKSFGWMMPFTRGVPGPLLAVWFNLMSRIHKCPYRAAWAVPKAKIHKAICVMLEKDIPVLFSVGRNFPWIWKKDGVDLYRKLPTLTGAGKTYGHYMTITGMEQDEVYGELLQVSSWGKKYYIKWKDYEDFLNKKSCALFTNILYMTERG